MEGAGDLLPTDLHASFDRRTRSYREPFALARLVIAGQGASLSTGTEAAWSFLLRTPEWVEAGLRALLRERLGEERVPMRRKRAIVGSGLTVTPDLVLRGAGQVYVGDIKYKLAAQDWRRSDLYQIVFFAEAFHARAGLLLGFSGPSHQAKPAVRIGDQIVTEVLWSTLAATPEEAATEFVGRVEAWMAALEETQAPIRDQAASYLSSD